MNLAENLERVRRQIREASARAGRDGASVRLVAVSKGQPAVAIEELMRAGQLLFAENRVQEAKQKIPECSGRLSWHMIGHLQTNKCRDVVQLFDMVHGVDSVRLAVELDKWAARVDRKLAVLLEVNVAGESTKFGMDPARVPDDLAGMLPLRHLEVRGFMCMAPWSPDPERARPVFRRLRELRDACEARHGLGLPELSMGMSGDFEVAVEEGATLVRVGTSLFGERTQIRA